MNDEKLKHFKNIYNEIHPPEHLVRHGWEDLTQILPMQDTLKIPLFKYSFLFASMLLCITAGVVVFAQTSQPGTAFYPIKTASDQVIRTIGIPLEKKPVSTQVRQTHLKLSPTKQPAKPTVQPTVIQNQNFQRELNINPTVGIRDKSFNGKPTIDSVHKNEGNQNGKNQQVEGIKTEAASGETEKQNKGNNESKEQNTTNNSGHGNKKE
jgi:hypothetical protein